MSDLIRESIDDYCVVVKYIHGTHGASITGHDCKSVKECQDYIKEVSDKWKVLESKIFQTLGGQ